MKKLKSEIDYNTATPESFDGEKAARFMWDEFGTFGTSVGIQSKTTREAKKVFKKYKKKLELVFANQKTKNHE